MDTEMFVKEIIKNVLVDNIKFYKYTFDSSQNKDVTDLYWKEALHFYNNLSNDEKKSIFKIIYQVQIDTISTLFSHMDGVSWLEGQEEDFEFSYKEKKLEDLQEYFFMQIDNEGSTLSEILE